ncbi:MAG: RelA/SpoT domain-containing protein [bacterium]|jgi:putative GTP pyrophosphokinase|nr:RelA/SpoT domain-containing protein [Phycisphaerales bacterium]
MSFVTPQFSRNDVNRAGRLLAAADSSQEDLLWATEVLANWRACHLYPINTFQATLRGRIEKIDRQAIVAQRLKRAPSVVTKLQRFATMNLAQMQDIGGLRAIVSTVAQVRKLEKLYRDQNGLKHSLVSSKDYIDSPKTDGYRSTHLVFRYISDVAPAYNGLHIELQIRTKMQHAWATAVETMGTFLGQALKSGQGETKWREFFSVSSAALAHLEQCPPVPGHEAASAEETYSAVATAEEELGVLTKLQGFAIAANKIATDHRKGKYHLVILDTEARSIRLMPFSEKRLSEASAEYAKVEERTLRGEQVEAVLVAAGPIDALRKAYPNYFLDTHAFIGQIQKVIDKAAGPVSRKQRPRRK